MADVSEKSQRLERLLGYLARDRDNVALLSEAAEAAFDAGHPDTALNLLDRHQNLAALPPRLLNLRGLAAMGAGAHERAADQFRTLLEQWPQDAALRFNLAWSLAMAKQINEALAALDEATVVALPQAAMLQVQLLHELGEFEEAMAAAKRHLETHGDHPGLNAVTSVLAIDLEDTALAETCAQKSDSHPDGLATLATLALGRDEAEPARAMFRQVLEINPDAPRALVGVGLAELALGDAAAAAPHIEQGAEHFGDHLGSWIAAGWAYLLAGNHAKASALFSHALALDDTFAEAHGSMAVAALMDGRHDDANRMTQVALRLDPACFSGALAKALTLRTQGRDALGQALIAKALRTPIDASGRTVAQMLAKRALSQG